jgi:hypothetical protein
MEITIQQSTPATEDEYTVTFSSPLGNAHGSWLGIPPVLGATYQVELSVSAPLTWEIDITRSKKDSYSLGSAGEKIILNALLENFEDDGLAFLRLDNALVMVDTVGSPPPTGTFVEARIPSLLVTDIGA